MSHIDPGTLHEYLDGELSESRRSTVEDHLAGCEACQTRLEEARALARTTGDLLAELEPGPTPAPAWDELRQRAEARSSGGSGQGNWLKPGLAWAASIALAFVMGWSASNYLELTPGLMPTAAERSSSTLVTDRENDAQAVSPPDARDAAEPAESSPAGRIPPAAFEEAAKTGATAGDAAPVPAPAPQRAESQNEGALEPKQARADAVSGVEALELQPRERAIPQTARPAADVRPVAERNIVRGQEAAGTAAEIDTKAPSLADAEGEEIWVDALGRAALGEEQRAALMDALRQDVRQRSGFRAAAATLFRTVGSDEAERLLGGELRTLPGLQRRRLEIGPGAAVPGAILDVPVVRAVYRDAAENEITLVQQRPGQGTRVEDEDDALPTLTVSPSGLTAYRWQDSAGYRLVLIGELSGDSLRALADRVR